jgi:hypothetical protein
VDGFLSAVADVYVETNQPTRSEVAELAAPRLDCALDPEFTDVPENPGSSLRWHRRIRSGLCGLSQADDNVVAESESLPRFRATNTIELA